jgi:hypothetical protein
MNTQYIKKNDAGTFYYSDKKMTKCHREDGPAVEWADGTKFWWLNGKYHREDGPAVEYSNGTKIWYLNGKLHREDGPAVEWASGNKFWYLSGQPLSKEEWEKRTGKKKTININGKAFTIEELNALIASVK